MANPNPKNKFQKGHPGLPGAGRPPGATNVLTRDSGLVDVSRRTCFTTNARAISRVTSTIPFDPLTNFG
jgi:hypothetical protein